MHYTYKKVNYAKCEQAQFPKEKDNRHFDSSYDVKETDITKTRENIASRTSGDVIDGTL